MPPGTRPSGNGGRGRPGSVKKVLIVSARSAEIYPDRLAVIHGAQRHAYADALAAYAPAQRGVKRGNVVAAMLPTVPAILEAHHAVPMLGAVLNTINARLDAETTRTSSSAGRPKR